MKAKPATVDVPEYLAPVTFDLRRGRVHSVAAGEPGRPPVIGLHGWSPRNDWRSWEPLLAPLAEAGFYAVSLDMPGWGASAPWSEGPLSDELAWEVVLAVIAALGAERAALMGKSWGGGIAVQVAAREPSQVSALILSAPAVRSLEDVESLTQPVLLAWAEDDPTIPYAFAPQLAGRIPRAELVAYPHGGHSAAARNAADFGPRAAAFLNEHHRWRRRLNG